MIYLGTLGRMIGIKCPASQNVEHEERYSFQTTLEGRRKAQPRPIGRRTWSLQTSDATKPAQASALMQFAQGAWGAGPFVFVSADAPVSNLLLPSTASCAPEAIYTSNVSAAGPVLLPDGIWAARSFANSSAASEMYASEHVPVVPEVTVTGSAWVFGEGARVRVGWYDAAGGALGSSVSTVTAGAGSWVRSSITAKPPTGAASCRLVGTSALRLTMPSVTWTDHLLPFADGQGCQKAVVHAVSRDLRLAVAGSTYSNLGFTVTEVG